jgi:hypothetical protein
VQLSFRIGVHLHSRYIKNMRFAGTLIIAATLLFPAAVRAQDAAEPGGPYASIVSRNMFALVPIPPPPDPAASLPPPEPPPKITPNGIMTIFGKLQALFKVAGKAKGGQPAKDESYVLTEGERQNDIEVIKINQAEGIITFNNHGTIQPLALVPAKDATSAAGPGGPGAGFNPGMRPPGAMMSNMTPAERAAMLRRPSAGRTGVPDGNNAGNPNFNSGGFPSAISQPKTENDTLSPEERAILMEAQRMKYQQEGNPVANLLPPPSPAMQKVINDINNEGNPGAPGNP